MDTWLIVVIVVAAVILLGLLVMLPRMRASARRKQAERELHSRRETVAEEHRSAASERETRAEMAEQKARMAEEAAQRERAEANLQSERAQMHERGMADEELVDPSERDRFRDVANPPADDRRFEREQTTDRESERR
jgi:predicted Holliday junction resolvase-like endonuclease